MGWVILLLTCIFFVPMSTIDDYRLSFGTPTVARGRSRRLGVAPVARRHLGYPEGTALLDVRSGGVLIGCARNRKRKSFMHMGTDG